MTAMTDAPGNASNSPLRRSEEVEDLIDAVKSLVVPYIRAADESSVDRAHGHIAATEASGGGQTRNVLVESHRPEELARRMHFSLPDGHGRGRDGLLDSVRDVLRWSVNTWDQGFLDKLYSSTNPVGVVSELLLSVLNTNVHVYQTSPSLTIVEKSTARNLAALFGLEGPRAGGVTCPGGSASNLTSLITARNTLYPETKVRGNVGHNFALFTSAHGHYSVEKAAVATGMGSRNVITVPVDASGRMRTAALEDAIQKARGDGMTPLYVNGTAGTTVLGSFDPFDEIADVCKREGLWMHVDGSWGGGVVFSAAQRHKLKGVERADSITFNPHKMLNVPVTCSFLLTGDLSVFHRANTLPAGYLFHSDGDDGGAENENEDGDEKEESREYWDLADLTLQCGRRGDSLKLALAWIYYGAAGFESQVDHAFAMATHLASLVRDSADFTLVSTDPPPCLQVCFYYTPSSSDDENDNNKKKRDADTNTRYTRAMVRKLVDRGFMIDYAPGEEGSFFRVVVNCQTRRETVDGLFRALREIGRETVEEQK